MRANCLVALLVLYLTSAAIAQDAHKPKVTNESPTNEQVEVYRVVLLDFLKDSKDKLKLSNMTEPAEQSVDSLGHGCPKTSSTVTPDSSTLIVHRLDTAATLDPRVELVDSDRQVEEIKNGDPAILLKRVINERENIPPKEIDDATEQAVKNGLFKLSEIIFNKKHNRALVSYDFVCGEICGHGEVLLLKKVGGKWKVHKTCNEWFR